MHFRLENKKKWKKTSALLYPTDSGSSTDKQAQEVGGAGGDVHGFRVWGPSARTHLARVPHHHYVRRGRLGRVASRDDARLTPAA